MRKTLGFLFPVGSFRRKVLKKILTILHLRNYTLVTYYNTWFWQHHQGPELGSAKVIKNGPKISIVVPAYNTPKRHFTELLCSIIAQSYENWELIIVNASDDKLRYPYIAAATEVDARIKVIDTPNKGIAGNTNLGLEAAEGTFIAFCDHDDCLDPWALYEVAKAITEEGAELMYSDEDKVSDDSQTYFDPHFKPDWSPDLLTHVNYVNHLTVMKKSLVDKVGRLDPRKDGAQDYDLLLKVIDQNPVIYHIPKVLYHWRAALTSTAQNFDSKSNVTVAGVNALKEHFERQGLHDVSVVSKADRPGFYSIKPQPYPKLSVIVLPFASNALLRLYVEILLLKTDLDKTKLELIIPSDVVLKTKEQNYTVKSLDSTDDFMQQALKAASHEQVIILNSVALPVKTTWAEELSGLLRLKHVGAAAPLIIRQGSLIEDGGLVRTSETGFASLFSNAPYLNNQTFFGNTDWVRNVDALSGNFIMARKSELQNFLSSRPAGRHQNDLQAFSTHHKDAFNVVFSDVLFDTHSVRLQPTTKLKTYFNPNLVELGSGYEIYSSESAAIGILINEREIHVGKML